MQTEIREHVPAETPEERKLAAAMHVGAVFFPWLAPFIGIVLSGKSRYIRFHSISSLVGEALAALFIGLVVAASLTHSIVTLYHQYQEGFRDFNLWTILIKSVAVWLGLFLFGLWNGLCSIISAVKALKGSDWGGRGLADRIARRWAGVRLPSSKPARR
jgi:uncharacterized membrane protein